MLIAVIQINNIPLKVEAASLNKASISLKVKGTYELKISSGKVSKWISSMPGVASVKNGKITALNVGTTIITAKTSNGDLKCTVNVKQSSNKKYKKQEYVVSKEFKKGYYVLYRNSDIEKASYAIYNGTEKITNNIISMDEFEYTKIAYLDKDQLLYMENCYAKKMEQSIVRTSSGGNIKVGTHIKAGKYKIVSTNDSDTIMCTISKDWNSDTIVDNIVLSAGATQNIKVSNGQYITLIGCRLLDN